MEQDFSHVDHTKPIFDDSGKLNFQAMINRDTKVVHAKPEHCDERGVGKAEHEGEFEPITAAEAHRRAGKDELGNRAAGPANDQQTEVIQLRTELEQLKKKVADAGKSSKKKAEETA